MDWLIQEYKGWKYKNTTFLIISTILIAIFADSNAMHSLLVYLGQYQLISAFVAGVFFVSTFTFVPAGIVLFHLVQILNPFLVAILAGAGAMCGDLVMFRFFRGGLFNELQPIISRMGKDHLNWLWNRHYFVWLAPVVGAIFVMLPLLPDEPGIMLMGASKLKVWEFMILSFVLNSVGILFVIYLAHFF